MLCFRLHQDDQPTSSLAEAVTALREGRTAAPVHEVDPISFRQIPNAPFAYWVSERIRRIFTELPAFEGEGRTVRQGLATANDFRFVRTSWETPTNSKNAAGCIWFPFAKGGSYSPFYADVFLKVNWGGDGAELDTFSGSVIRNANFYFRPGLTWPRRTNGLSFRALPASCVFADKGPAAFSSSDSNSELLSLVALVNSKAFGVLVSTQLARVELAQSFEVGLVQATPIPKNDNPRLSKLAFQAWSAQRLPDTAMLTSHAFVAPALIRATGSIAEGLTTWSVNISDSTATVAAAQAEIDDIAFALYGIGAEDRSAIEALLTKGSTPDEENGNDEEKEPDDLTTAHANGPHLVSSVLDYAFGTAFGRWDIRYATGERQPPKLPDPFDPLPVCPPGMLQGEDGLPLERNELRRLNDEGSYPLRVTVEGILIDDASDPEDIVSRVREGLRVIWGDRATAIEQEAIEILQDGGRTPKDLRDYFRTPGQFFKNHLDRYSKSRRKAPIYWPISTASGDYTLWLYYHRLDDQTLLRCVNRIKTKLESISTERRRLDNESNRSSAQDTDLKKLQSFEEELLALQNSLEAISKYWKPNLNDGVQITAAPLWEHFNHKPWRKVLKDTWEKLQHGDYDWAHLAHSIWPERVIPKCAQDRSLAIAHGHEDRLWHQVEVRKGKSKKKKLEWQPVPNAEEVVAEILKELKVQR